MSDIVVSPQAVNNIIISITRKGGSPSRFLVSSVVLCGASSVFTAMLGPCSPFAEAVALRRAQAAGGDLYVQPLSDDDPVALAVTLSAMHFKLENVPRETTVEQLMQLAIVCDKYNCAAVLKQWVEKWITIRKCQQVKKPTQSIQMLFVAWVFGADGEFGELTQTLVPKIAFSGASGRTEVCRMLKPPRGGLRQIWPPLSFGAYVPSVVLDAMMEQREVIVRAILAACKSMFAKYASFPVQLQCRHPCSSKYCDNIILASLFRTFSRIGILGFDHKEVKDQSLERLIGEIKGIKIGHLTYQTWDAPTRQYNEVNHSSTCDPLEPLFSLVSAELKKIVPLQLASFRRNEGAMSWEMWEKKLGVE